MKKLIITIIVSIIVGIAAIVFTLFKISSWAGGSSYYTQIVNHGVEHNEGGREGVIDFKGGLPYVYNLPAFDERGEEHFVSFGASKELREGAFIRLKIVPVRSVTSWEEVNFDDLPNTVQEKYS